MRSIRVILADDHAIVRGAIRKILYGAAGYITKDEEPEVIIQAVRKVARGKRRLFSPKAKKTIGTIQGEDRSH